MGLRDTIKEKAISAKDVTKNVYKRTKDRLFGPSRNNQFRRPSEDAPKPKKDSMMLQEKPIRQKLPVTEADTTATKSTLQMSRTGPPTNLDDISTSTTSPTESIQDRIARVKQGQMSNAEKQAFLESALTAGTSSRSRKPVVQGGLAPDASQILRQVSMGKVAKDAAVIHPTSAQDRQKKAFLDMVTNPNRFARYQSYQPTSAATRTIQTPAPPPTKEATEESDAPNNVDFVVEPVVVEPPAKVEDRPKDLGERLAQAALDETQQKQQAAQKKLDEGPSSEELQEELQEQARQLEEQQRQQKQQDYWAQRLAAEQSQVNEQNVREDPDLFVQTIADDEDYDDEPVVTETTSIKDAIQQNQAKRRSSGGKGFGKVDAKKQQQNERAKRFGIDMSKYQDEE